MCLVCGDEGEFGGREMEKSGSVEGSGTRWCFAERHGCGEEVGGREL